MNLTWIAGFYEGEGCATGDCIGRGYLRITITQSDREILLRIRKYLGYGRVNIKRVKSKKYKTQWVLNLSGKTAHKFAKEIIPYLQMPKRIKQLKWAVKKYPA